MAALDAKRVVILGAGVSGHTAAQYLTREFKGSPVEIVVISPNKQWNWIPSNIWVGTGAMPGKKVVFDLPPVYRKMGAVFHQAKATEIHPEGDGEGTKPYVVFERTEKGKEGQVDQIDYDYLINATGPQLNFEKTPGLGPDGYSLSVCTKDHAVEAAEELQKIIRELKATGEKKTLVVGMGHGTCTCEGAAFEYAFNVDDMLRKNGVRDKAELIYFTNEVTLGDFGVGGMQFKDNGYLTDSRLWTESIFRERGVHAVVGACATKIEEGKIHYETLDGSGHELDFDFAMLLPPFSGVPLKGVGPKGEDIGEKLFAPNGMMKVDATYGKTNPDDWVAADWPETYQNPAYDNIWAVGIAFAPPHPISIPNASPNGVPIAPAPPRTGMPSGTMGRIVAETIIDRIKNPETAEPHRASLTRMGAACVASTGVGLKAGSAASMLMHPVVPNYELYPETGRSKFTTGDVGLSGHWIKLMLHFMFIWKARSRPFWFLIPE
ncbi:NAD(P)/FAD-dependent oxidoreductase [Corynebacterium sp. H78]|uniref:NAD(P)/FAD-dependent oxidoreductase n=1 Tax=Corynebacterium sp. H78 TaxID=3133417 RepID=UPI00309A7CB7